MDQSVRYKMKDVKRNTKDARKLETNGEVRSLQQLCSNDDAFFHCNSRRWIEDEYMECSEVSREVVNKLMEMD